MKRNPKHKRTRQDRLRDANPSHRTGQTQVATYSDDGEVTAYRNGVVWHAWEAADSKLSEDARRWRYWVREYRDAYREAFGYFCDAAVLQRCYSADEKVGDLIGHGVPAATIKEAAEATATMILLAVKKDPDGAPDLADALENLADRLTERSELQFAVPGILVALSLLWVNDGEPEAAQELLDCVIRHLDQMLASGASPNFVARGLALAYRAQSDLCCAIDDPEGRLLAAKAAWDKSHLADPACQCFAIDGYRAVLEDQGHPRAVVEAADHLSQIKRAEAGAIRDWLLLNWPLLEGEHTYDSE